MRVIPLVWLCGLVIACRGTAERGSPAGKPGVLANAVSRVQIVYDLDVGSVLSARASTVAHFLEAGLAEQQVVASVAVSAAAPGALSVTPADPANRAAIEQWLTQMYSATVEQRTCEASAGPGAICVRIAAALAAAVRKAALARAVETIRVRLEAGKVADPTVVTRGDQIVVEFPATDAQGLALRSRIAHAGTLELKVIEENSELMKRVYAHVGNEGPQGRATEPRAIAEGITADVDVWRPDDGGAVHQDYYLIARDREEVLPLERAKDLGCPTAQAAGGSVRCTVSGRRVLERYLAELAAKDPARFQAAEDRQLGYERVTPQPDAKDPRPYWRTYYLERAAALTGAAVASASAIDDPSTGRPLILLDFNRDGARAFAELTARITGKKLATLFDDTIKSAPIINGEIRGGRATISMGGSDLGAQTAERDALVNALRIGSLPAPLREVSSTTVP